MSFADEALGKKFGRLLITDIVYQDCRRKLAYICDCGTGGIVDCRQLKAGQTTSCGCLARDRAAETRKKEGHGLATVLSNIRQKAKSRNLGWALRQEFGTELLKQNCFYCGSPPDKRYRDLEFSGIDRVDSTKPYIEENVVACCTKCNFAKNAQSVEEFKNHIQKIYKHLFKDP